MESAVALSQINGLLKRHGCLGLIERPGVILIGLQKLQGLIQSPDIIMGLQTLQGLI